MDSIQKFSKNKGFESLPRELLQSKELSLEAIGLLCNLQSYPENWILRKTEIRRRFKNSEKVVDKIWDELVSKGYIIQFRRREGKKYSYQYFFNTEKFSVNETQELLETMFSEGFLLYHKSMKKNTDLNLRKYLFLTEDEKCNLDLSFLNFQNGNSKKDDCGKDSSTFQFGKSKMEMSNTEDSRSTEKRLTKKREEEIIEIEKGEDHEQNCSAPSLKNLLKESNLFTQKDIQHVLSLLKSKEISTKIVQEQLEMMKIQTMIYDPAHYFVEGVRRRKRFDDFKNESKILPKVSLYNWLD
ncbi:hypothetical protein [Enterococcus sp. DIV0098]|uniref:hypothetical protein n=1 Tax=Enterococcus sp. DIV0098 TaxID=2774843 RepID=UPI003F6836CF